MIRSKIAHFAFAISQITAGNPQTQILQMLLYLVKTINKHTTSARIVMVNGWHFRWYIHQRPPHSKPEMTKFQLFATRRAESVNLFF